MFYGNNNNNLRQSAEEKYKKEAERKRKEEYRKFLDLQLAEKERNKALEQQKRREEDIKFDNKINLQRQELQQQYQQYQIQNATNTYNNNNNNINMDNRPQTYQNFNTQFQPSPPPKYISHNINKKDPNIESPENMFANPISSMPNFYPNTNQQLQLQMQQQQQPLSSHEPNLQEYNMNNQIMYQQQQQQQQPTFYMDQQQQGNMGLQQQANANNLMYNTPPTFNRTGPIQQPYYTPQTTGPNVNVLMNSGNNAINPQVTEEILLTFANNQRDILKEYELKMKQYNENPETSTEQIKLIKDLYNERNNALDRIKQEQENLRNALGFYPWKAQLTEKLANLFDIILERKISIIEKNTTLKEQYLKQQQQQQQHQRYSSSNTNKNYLSSSLTQQNPQQSQSKQNYHLQRKNINSAYPSKHHTNNNYFPPLKESTTNYVNNNNININNNNNTSQINLDDLCYRSKYEDIKRSIMVPEDINPEFKASMAGFSKFVTARDNTNPNNKLSNPNNISNTTTYLYQTWRDQSQLNTLGNIKEVDEYRIIENKDNNVDLSQQSLSSSSQKRNIMNNKSNNNQSKCIQRSNNVKNSNAISKVSRCMESAKQMRISKEEKDKSLIFGMDQDDMMNIQGGSGGIVDDNINIQQSTIPTHEHEHEQGHEVLFKTIDAQKNNYCNRK